MRGNTLRIGPALQDGIMRSRRSVCGIVKRMKMRQNESLSENSHFFRGRTPQDPNPVKSSFAAPQTPYLDCRCDRQ